MTATEILVLLEKKHAPHPMQSGHGDWFFIPELRLGTGFLGSDSRMDAFAMQQTPSKGHTRIGYEIKVSRADFMRDIAKADKHRQARMFVNEFWFVAPKGVIPREKLPIWAGLLEVVTARNDGSTLENPQLHVTVRAAFCESEPPTWNFVAALVRRAQKLVQS